MHHLCEIWQRILILYEKSANTISSMMNKETGQPNSKSFHLLKANICEERTMSWNLIESNHFDLKYICQVVMFKVLFPARQYQNFLQLEVIFPDCYSV